MRDRELIAKNIINIIDIANCHNWILFTDEDMFNKVYDYIVDISKNSAEAEEYAKKIMLQNKTIIDEIVQGDDISNFKFNTLMESFRKYKRKFMLK